MYRVFDLTCDSSDDESATFSKKVPAPFVDTVWFMVFPNRVEW